SFRRPSRLDHSTEMSRCLTIFSLTASSLPDMYTLSLHDALPICQFLLMREMGFARGDPFLARNNAMRLHGWLLNPAVQLANASRDRKSTRLNSSHSQISYAVFCLKKKKNLSDV